ncbi:MAG: type II secretion system protein [Colwellia sp.]|nr:type II secretion system protein [Colwellia sp.]
MNIGQIKTAIAKFKNANVSILKDDAMRAKAQKLQAKQKGFTLLELLVVITLLATLSTAALVAYDGAGENARDAAAATAVNTLEGSLRNYRSIVGEYPEQFDSLANADADATNGNGAMQLMSDETRAFFGQLVISQTLANAADDTTVTAAIAASLRDAGLEELQAVIGATTWNDGFVPNLAMNESYTEYTAATVAAGNQGSELGFPEDLTDGAITFDDAAVTGSVALSIVPSGRTGAASCGVFTLGDLQTTFSGDPVNNNAPLNLISDGLESDGCDLVVALGIGKEVPGATLGNAVEIAQVPTVGTNNINPRDNYARAIALFQVGHDIDNNGLIAADEIFDRARLIAVVGPEGRTIDQLAAAATASTADDS